MKRKAVFLAISAVLLFQLPTVSQTYVPLSGRFHLMAEYGFLDVPYHIIQFGNNGSEINYPDEAGQDILFPFLRLAVRFDIAPSHIISVLYQPLSLITEETTNSSLNIDGVIFPQGTPVRFVYNFPFYRTSYVYLFTKEDSPLMLGVGGALQIRNASISFASLDGTLLRTNRDVGLVPLLEFVAGYRVAENLWLETDISGIYAPIRYLNISDTDVEGALVDASLRAVVSTQGPFSLYLNARYLAGGAEGTSDPQNPGSDGFVKNWLQFLTLSLGFVLSL